MLVFGIPIMANIELPRGQRSETAAAPSNVPEKAHPPKRGLGLLVGIAVFIAAIALGFLWFKHRPADKTKSTGQAGRGFGGFGPVPVLAGTVIQKDVPIY